MVSVFRNMCKLWYLLVILFSFVLSRYKFYCSVYPESSGLWGERYENRFLRDDRSVRSSYMSSACIGIRLRNGRIRFGQRAKLVKFNCFLGYELVGNKYATCKDGRLDVPVPVCVKPGCPAPQIENGIQLLMNNGAWVVFFCRPGHKLVGSSAIYCDGYRWNDTAPACVDTTATNNLSCNFEDPDICGWTQDELHDFDWKRLNKKTPSSFLFTGPSYDHTYGEGKTGYYMYIESTSRLTNETARLISPLYDSSLAENGCFSFYYHMFGRSIGGLRVYQKPENYDLQTLLKLPNEEKQNYILFEKWGNQGDVWYNDVPTLKNFSQNFQIVVEGIRGSSYTSDIAIDDVSILQGENCTKASNAAVTPTVLLPQSCNGRCSVFDTPRSELGCGCTISCVSESTCCVDFFDLCVFATDSTTVEDTTMSKYSTELAPRTAKLVAKSPDPPVTKSKTTTTPTTTTVRSTIRTSKARKLITTPPLTTKIIATTKTTKLIATKIPQLKFKSTVRVYNATGLLHKKNNTVITTNTISEVKTTIAIKPTTSHPFGISRTLENHNVYDDMIEKAKKEQKTEKTARKSNTDKDKSSSSGIMSGVIMVIMAACVCASGWWAWRRGSLRHLRTRTTCDPEVRYLTAHADED